MINNNNTQVNAYSNNTYYNIAQILKVPISLFYKLEDRRDLNLEEISNNLALYGAKWN